MVANVRAVYYIPIYADLMKTDLSLFGGQGLLPYMKAHERKLFGHTSPFKRLMVQCHCLNLECDYYSWSACALLSFSVKFSSTISA